MSEIVSSTVAGYIANLGLDAIVGFSKKVIDKKKLRESLISYIEQQRKYNEICTFAEEIDFQGLVEYIHDNLLDEVIQRIICIKPKERQAARKKIVNSAICYSKAKTREAQSRVAKNIYSCLDIIKDFYRKKSDVQDYIIAAEIIDSVNEHTSQAIDTAKEEIIESIKQNTGSLFSIEELTSKAQSGDLSAANDCLKVLFDIVSTKHPLSPYYGYGWKNQKMVSEPLIPEASEKYPVRYVFNGPVKIGNKYVSDPTVDVVNYAYRHQLQLVMKVKDAKKYLGDIMDPAQYEVEKYVGGEIYAKPPEFPPAFACSIKVKNLVCFEYVLIRTQEILDDGTYIFSNQEQTNTHLRFEFRVSRKSFHQNGEVDVIVDREDTGFKISIQDASNAEILKYVKFIKAVTTERDLRLHILEKDQDLFAAKIDNMEYSSGFKDIDEEIDFLERICDIEKFFNVSFHIEGAIMERDYRTILLVSDLIRNDQVEEKWKNVSCTGIIDEGFRNNLIEMRSEIGTVSYVDTMDIDIFRVHLELRYMRTIYDAIIEDYERIVKIVELSEDGDPIKITLVSKNDKYTISLHIPEIMMIRNEDASETQV